MVLFGAMVAMPWVFFAWGPPWWVGFALFHGLANGAGMPLAASAPAYLAGLAVSTALLHPAGAQRYPLAGQASVRRRVTFAAGGLMLALV